MSNKAFSSIRSAAIDGRAWNPFFKKTQLKKLHEALVARATNIKAAMEKDTGNTRFEIATEYWLALRCLAQVYDSIDTDTELKLEYRIANSKDASDARDPVGIVVIEPLAQTFLYSLLSALAPAIGAGNCVIVQMGRSMLATPSIVLPLVQAALVEGTFEVSYTTVSDNDINHRHCRIMQNGPTATPLAHHIVSESKNRIIAVVERDADVDEAARSLVTARFSIRGKSAYAPDLVLVNEWIRKDFLAALSKQSIALGNSYVSETRPAKASPSSNLVQEVMKGGSGSVHSTSQYGAIVEIEESFGRLSAAYVFTAPAAAKYICQFLNASICLVNHIPLKLLYGPIAPADHSFSPDTLTPYSERHFTLAKGQFIEPTKDGQRLAQLFFEASPKGCQTLHEEASAALKDMHRVKKGGDIGFFNQGIVTGGIIVLSTAISCTGLLCYYLVKVARSTL
ncbi:conserved hypothetical protein [Verticillium alfalfae VaMs.102]|uniref:Aldehyde dehydrogenase domain-containing protein n=1 Tax=Verticillium alfalfae (strain VaMs.102 / ATCC MYA-4576 / FGSC 10136) TaxID=526221 RepID=C9SEB5_VERA1|nr:conserved hypothetical protein [Verticillium alfalfae VaMs.102]EEY16508.1 conserved hypothetical protein [Verticillium alfalfae VaMs.102]